MLHGRVGPLSTINKQVRGLVTAQWHEDYDGFVLAYAQLVARVLVFAPVSIYRL